MKTSLLFLALVLATAAGGYALRAMPAAAQTHAEVCQSNYDQCIKGCDGATSCSNQCQVNKDQCNQQNQ